MLINCAVYAEGKRAETLDLNTLDRARTGDGRFIWVALKDAAQEEVARLQRHFGLHPLAIEDAMTGHQRPKLEEYGTTLFSVIQLLERVDGEISVGEIDIFIDRDFIVSFRSNSNQDFLGVRQRCETEPELLRHGPGYVFYAMLDHVVDRYFELTESLQSELESIEEDIFVRPTHASISSAFSSSSSSPRCCAMRRFQCRNSSESSTEAGCRQCARSPRSTSATFTTIWQESWARSMRSASRSPPPSRSTSQWSRSKRAK